METSSAEAQLIERRQAPVITDNIGSQEMKDNGDRDAASAMERVTGVSIVENSYVFVRGLGERYSNTTLAGSVLPTTEPDKKVVPLDLFPDGSDRQRAGEQVLFARQVGGVRRRTRADHSNQAPLPASPRPQLRNRLLRERNGQRYSAQPAREPRRLGIRQRRAGAASGDPELKDRAAGHLHAGRRLLQQSDHRHTGSCSRTSGDQSTRTPSPGRAGARPSAIASTSFGVVASATHSYKEQFVEEDRRFFRIGDAGTLDAASDYHMLTGVQKAQLGVVANLSYQFSTNQRITLRELLYAQRPR